MESDKDFPNNVSVFFPSLAHDGEPVSDEAPSGSPAVILPFRSLLKNRTRDNFWPTGSLEESRNPFKKSSEDDDDFDPPPAS